MTIKLRLPAVKPGGQVKKRSHANRNQDPSYPGGQGKGYSNPGSKRNVSRKANRAFGYDQQDKTGRHPAKRIEAAPEDGSFFGRPGLIPLCHRRATACTRIHD